MTETVAEKLRLGFDGLTRAERQLANFLLENYPVSGLVSITKVAKGAQVSTPTVARMVQKLGYSGFPEFQTALRSELEAVISGPIAKHDRWAEAAPDGHILNRFTDAVIGNIRQTLATIDPQSFDSTVELIADTDRTLFVVGGRITRTLADYFFLHCQVIRPNVTLVQAISNAWPHYLLDMKKDDVLVIFDVRRYETSTLKLAELAREKEVKIILFTDQWRSPVAVHADHCFSARIEAPSAWDSSIMPLLLLESIIAAVQESTWDQTKERMEILEDLFDKTRFFRKFL